MADEAKKVGELARAAGLLDIRTPAEELRRLVRARMETLAKLGGGAGEGGERLDVYAAALELGLERLREAGR